MNIPEPSPRWPGVLLVVRLVVKGALFASSPMLFGLVIGYAARPTPLQADDSFYGFLGGLFFAACFSGALCHPLILRTPLGRSHYKPELIELAPKLLTKGWVYPVTAFVACILGGSLVFSLITPDPKSSALSNALFGGFFTPIFGFAGLTMPAILEALREQWKLSNKKLNAGAVVTWGLVMLASHPWTVETKAGPVMTTIVIGLLAAALLGQYRLL